MTSRPALDGPTISVLLALADDPVTEPIGHERLDVRIWNEVHEVLSTSPTAKQSSTSNRSSLCCWTERGNSDSFPFCFASAGEHATHTPN